MKKVIRWKMEMPTEAEMLPKDKYTVFDRKVKRYRKGIHSTCRLACVIVGLAEGLTCSRGTEMDESQSETQSPRFLGWIWRTAGGWNIYYVLSYPLHGTWRWLHEYNFLCDGEDVKLANTYSLND